MKERTIDFERAIITHNQTPEISQPADRAFDYPASSIPALRPPILCRRANAIFLVRADPFDSPPPQTIPQRIAVVSSVGDHPH